MRNLCTLAKGCVGMIKFVDFSKRHMEDEILWIFTIMHVDIEILWIFVGST